MSGQPYRYASDPERYRTEFLDTLALRANIDDMNLQANKTYKLTGQLPPVSQMQETRTTSEILADNERLKIDIIKAMREVGDAQFAQAVIQRIQNSPLNATGSLFVFFAQRVSAIIKNLKDQYYYKIKGNANDVETFASFVEDMFTKTKSMTSSVKGYFTNEYNTKHKLTDIRDWEELDTLFKKISHELTLKLKPSGGRNSKINKKLITIAKGFLTYKQFLSSIDFIENMKTIISVDHDDVDGNLIDQFYDANIRYNEIIEQLPKPATLFTLLDMLSKTLKNSNMSATDDILSQFEGLLSSVDEASKLLIKLRELNNEFYKIPQIDVENQPQQEEKGPSSLPPYEPSPLPTQPLPTQHEPSPPPPTQEETGGGEEEPSSKEPIDTEELKSEIDRTEKLIETIENELKKFHTNLEFVKQKPDSNDKNMKIKLLLKKINDLDEQYTAAKQYLETLNSKISGHGLRRRGRPKGCGVGKRTSYTESVKAHTAYDKGVMESPRFVKFGRYLVNTHKLNKDDILALKQPSGATLVDFPSVRISKNLSNVVKKMIGGGVPSYNELNGLSEPEKVYLHKISSKANILDKFSIPAPSKDQQEKDIHEFEVLKGEIMAGNDSKELIKKFKLHLIKLSKNGSLPKKEVAEIMEELLQLGF